MSDAAAGARTAKPPPRAADCDSGRGEKAAVPSGGMPRHGGLTPRLLPMSSPRWSDHVALMHRRDANKIRQRQQHLAHMVSAASCSISEDDGDALAQFMNDRRPPPQRRKAAALQHLTAMSTEAARNAAAIRAGGRIPPPFWQIPPLPERHNGRPTPMRFGAPMNTARCGELFAQRARDPM